MRYYLCEMSEKEISKENTMPAEGVFAAACMALLVVITLVNVLVRYFSDQSFAWTEEISVFLMVLMTFAGAASVARRDAHIRIEFFYDTGSEVRRSQLRIFSAAVASVFFLVMAYLFGLALLDDIKYAETTMGLGIPRSWYTVWIPPLCLLIAWRCLQPVLRKK